MDRPLEVDMSKRVKYAAAIAAAALLVLLAADGWIIYRTLNATWVHNYHIQYAGMPVTDDALTDWLKSQPGVIHATVSREKNGIVVNYEVQRGHSTPDAIGKSKEFGYTGLDGFTGDFKYRW
jgi:hypothetical protein